jgi:hypothetical protein
VDELRGLLNKYRPSSVLKACARLSILFGFGPDRGTTADQETTTQWIPVLLDKDIAARALKLSKRGRILFFQAQLRYLAAAVIQLSLMPAEDLPEVPDNILGELVLRGPATVKPPALPEDTYCDDPSDRRERYLPVDGGSVFAALNPPPRR